MGKNRLARDRYPAYTIRVIEGEETSGRSSDKEVGAGNEVQDATGGRGGVFCPPNEARGEPRARAARQRHRDFLAEPSVDRHSGTSKGVCFLELYVIHFLQDPVTTW